MNCRIWKSSKGWVWEVTDNSRVICKSSIAYPDWKECVKSTYHIGKFLHGCAPERLDSADSPVCNFKAISERLDRK